MVRLVNKENIGKLADLVYGILHIQEFFTHIIEINHPEVQNCIYAIWHADQFCVYGIRNNEKLNILVSNSADGEFITRIIHKMGMKTVRGSSARKGCVSSTLQLITKLKEGENVAIMVDGPHGPLHKVKGGAIKLAQETGLPIVPLHWYSAEKTFFSLPSWDKMTTPIGNCHIINLYGEPIYAKPDDKPEDIAQLVANSLENLQKIAPEEFIKAKKQKLWKKRK